jgi:DNA-binding PadR family transcriptional regulator
VILKLLTEQPSYGYQLIKTMEERLSGGYTPSAGVIYPTLTLLEEEGLASVSNSADNKKVYTVTAAGLEYLKENKERIEELFARLEEAGKGFERGRSPEIMRAFMNLRGAVMARVSREVTAEQIKKITEAINGAAKAIDEL